MNENLGERELPLLLLLQQRRLSISSHRGKSRLGSRVSGRSAVGRRLDFVRPSYGFTSLYYM